MTYGQQRTVSASTQRSRHNKPRVRSVSWAEILCQRRIRHTEARAHVLGYQFDGGAITERIGLRQIPHRLHQQTLALDITRIGGSFAPLSVNLRWYRDGKNLCHSTSTHFHYRTLCLGHPE